MRGPTPNLGPIGSAVLTCIGYKQTSKAYINRLRWFLTINLFQPLKKGILWISAHTRRGRIAEVSDDVFEFTKQRYFKVNQSELSVGGGGDIEVQIFQTVCDGTINLKFLLYFVLSTLISRFKIRSKLFNGTFETFICYLLLVGYLQRASWSIAQISVMSSRNCVSTSPCISKIGFLNTDPHCNYLKFQ